MSKKVDQEKLVKIQEGLQKRFSAFIDQGMSPFLIGVGDYLEYIRSEEMVFQTIEAWVTAEKERAERKLRALESEMEVLLERFESADYSPEVFSASKENIKESVDKMLQYKTREILVGDAVTYRRLLVLLRLYENLREHGQGHVCKGITELIGKGEMDDKQLERIFRNFLTTSDTWEKEELNTIWGKWNLVKKLDLGLNGEKMIASHDGELPDGISFSVYVEQKAVANLKENGKFHKATFEDLKANIKSFHFFVQERLLQSVQERLEKQKARSVRYDKDGFFEINGDEKIPFLNKSPVSRQRFLLLWDHRSQLNRGKQENKALQRELRLNELVSGKFTSEERDTSRRNMNRLIKDLHSLGLPVEMRECSKDAYQIFVTVNPKVK
ncbi:hypothetical protein EPN81_00115 [Patescibacteria group bacterium]|nr:MAG: hypothetical protein EPN81_00115 [Patescibacteria group bacterium]